MSLFHAHEWREVARTYAKSLSEQGISSAQNITGVQAQGQTTILWECQDKHCQKLREQTMLGKESEGS